jgi:hypothetical protein
MKKEKQTAIQARIIATQSKKLKRGKTRPVKTYGKK